MDDLLTKLPFVNMGENNPELVVEEEPANVEEQPAQTPAEDKEDALVLSSAFFNDVKVVDGRNIIQNPENLLALVNKTYGLPSTYVPADLVRPNVPFSFGTEELEKSKLRQEAAQALEAMFAEAKKSGVNLFAVSGYRSSDRQSALFQAEVSKVGEEKAVQAVAFPGNSEHQTGLAIDISSHLVNLLLVEKLGETKDGKWLADNAYRFGYILRYPKGKESITGYQYEPWHFRFVGEEAAKVMYEKNLTMEEYFNMVEKI
ncbi:M15 family metallopeptidase [Cytobacillus spongiae]|jgi:D-alanyl-D-alanine carboxypeptidase|uniref:M15 family metallopeptidase n=1 Tax=Cytobacillus spongiae TaxID=2901381 RepID=UPI001F28FFB5|nr:M15 family metallopeptidase [Cytobacillus spongiae]UII54463.1 M15 family metallopeptidase [Cytobacillus spongiae]